MVKRNLLCKRFTLKSTEDMPFPALGQELGHTVPNMWFYSDLHVVLRPETISVKELLHKTARDSYQSFHPLFDFPILQT